MNNKDRKELSTVLLILEEAKTKIESLIESEQSKFDNLSDGLQQTERGQKLEENVSVLEDAVSEIDNTIQNLSDL